MRYKAVFFDVDGTLVDTNRRFHPATVAALHGLVRLGIHRSLATGRAFPSARPYVRAIAADAPLVLYNGAELVDPSGGTVLGAWNLPQRHARLALEQAKLHDLHVNLYLESGLYVERLGKRAQESMLKDGLTAREVGDLGAFLDRDPVKLLLIGPASACDAFKEELDRRCAPDPEPPTVVRSEPEYVEVLACGVNKGRALALACQELGLEPAETVAFGDGLNDLEMLRLAGLGVAPRNSHPEVRRQADRVIGEHNGPALGLALAEIFEIPLDLS